MFWNNCNTKLDLYMSMLCYLITGVQLVINTPDKISKDIVDYDNKTCQNCGYLFNTPIYRYIFSSTIKIDLCHDIYRLIWTSERRYKSEPELPVSLYNYKSIKTNITRTVLNLFTLLIFRSILVRALAQAYWIQYNRRRN